MNAPTASKAIGMNLNSDPAGGPEIKGMNGKNRPSLTSTSPPKSRLLGRILQFLLLDVPLLVLFALLLTTIVLHKLHDDYFYPLLKLMNWEGQDRDFLETTYFERYCTGEDFTAKSVSELIITEDYTTKDAANHMLRHGVSVYPNLVTNHTAKILRDWIVEENKVQEGWYVIENENRWSWGIDMTMHPSLHTFWQELAANEKLLSGLEEIIGPNPAIIEFTAITSAFGATDQYLHADVVPPGSATKFARSFLPSYSLFVPLQDTTYEMGATHVCPGSHLCSDGAKKNCKDHALAVSGPKGSGGVWKMGWGALVNQQTFHKGMGFTQEGAPDRVVLIATFAPRPIHHRGLETRMIGHGGSYSLLWNQWGHTFYDYFHADTRMTQPQATLRSLGILKSNGITYLSSASMRMANEEVGMREDNLEEFLERGGFSFLPESWQGSFGEESDVSEFHSFVLGTLKKTEKKLEKFNIVALFLYLSIAIFLDTAGRKSSVGFSFLKRTIRLGFIYGMLLVISWKVVRTVEESNWAKGIRAGKAYTLPWVEPDENRRETLPHRTDILLVPHYASSYMASYSHVIDVAHPGNKLWNDLVKSQADGYVMLPPVLQQSLCTTLLESLTADRRFLEQGLDRLWYNVTDHKQLTRFCHKEFLKAANPLRGALSHEIDSLKNELDFGMFRMTGMHITQIRGLLDDWEKRVLPPLQIGSRAKSSDVTKTTVETTVTLRPNVSLVAIGRRELGRKGSGRSRKSSPLFPRKTPNPPAPYAWLEVGDRVNVMDGCKDDGEYYPGMITASLPNLAAFAIEYDTGETEDEVNQRCVIPEAE
ncbi:hypothetical protein IV203_026679 [Nitzschia inconspicua]|uniref:Uncharacterized protein n=1 Tax=Nitzschia inconspicua TaxID=303405 RepID=A0A9K3LJ20_9STRA|nr:hypothetical protein IV203_026679 [Nitzschia inconspicua]